MNIIIFYFFILFEFSRYTIIRQYKASNTIIIFPYTNLQPVFLIHQNLFVAPDLHQQTVRVLWKYQPVEHENDR